MLVTRSVRCVKRSHVYYRCNYAVGAEEGEIKISCLYEGRGRGEEHNGSPHHGFSNEWVESINCRILINGIQYFLDLAKEDYRRNNWYSVFVLGTLEFFSSLSILRISPEKGNIKSVFKVERIFKSSNFHSLSKKKLNNNVVYNIHASKNHFQD